MTATTTLPTPRDHGGLLVFTGRELVDAVVTVVTAGEASEEEVGVNNSDVPPAEEKDDNDRDGEGKSGNITVYCSFTIIIMQSKGHARLCLSSF